MKHAKQSKQRKASNQARKQSKQANHSKQASKTSKQASKASQQAGKQAARKQSKASTQDSLLRLHSRLRLPPHAGRDEGRKGWWMIQMVALASLKLDM